MKTFAFLLLAASAMTSLHSPARADGFRYAGSPKFGETYVRTEANVPSRNWIDARAEMPQPAKAPQSRGGIGLRTP